MNKTVVSTVTMVTLFCVLYFFRGAPPEASIQFLDFSHTPKVINSNIKVQTLSFEPINISASSASD